MFEFDTDEAGNVRNISVVHSCFWQGKSNEAACTPTPDDGLTAAAQAAVARWKYEPAIQDGTAVPRQGVKVIMRFMLENR
jgi:outer membrane biosynthesis protein TonB